MIRLPEPDRQTRAGGSRKGNRTWRPQYFAVRAELDAFFARKYGLTSDEPRYVLDPANAKCADYPYETFRVLKNKEEQQFGE
jgi:hypothetical protein